MGGLASPTRLTSLHDQELAALAAAGDRRAFGELARRHNAAVRGLLMRMGADPSTADDLAQDAFLTAFARIADFRGEGSFAGWIKKIAARLYLKRWRRQRPFADESEAMELLAGSEGETAQRIDLDEALQSLSPAERVCVALCYGAGFSHSEAAEATGAPLGTVKSHVKRGLDKLRSRLAPSSGAGERVHV